MDQHKTLGGVALITQNDKIQYHQAFGFKGVEKNIDQEKSDIFRIVSMTKPITAVAAMMMYEEGKFDCRSHIANVSF